MQLVLRWFRTTTATTTTITTAAAATTTTATATTITATAPAPTPDTATATATATAACSHFAWEHCSAVVGFGISSEAVVVASLQLSSSLYQICPGLTLIRCTRISISVTKCPLALLANINITCVSEYRQFMSQSVPQMLLFK